MNAELMVAAYSVGACRESDMANMPDMVAAHRPMVHNAISNPSEVPVGGSRQIKILKAPNVRSHPRMSVSGVGITWAMAVLFRMIVGPIMNCAHTSNAGCIHSRGMTITPDKAMDTPSSVEIVAIANHAA